jgi:hypothetical protein
MTNLTLTLVVFVACAIAVQGDFFPQKAELVHLKNLTYPQFTIGILLISFKHELHGSDSSTTDAAYKTNALLVMNHLLTIVHIGAENREIISYMAEAIENLLENDEKYVNLAETNQAYITFLSNVLNTDNLDKDYPCVHKWIDYMHEIMQKPLFETIILSEHFQFERPMSPLTTAFLALRELCQEFAENAAGQRGMNNGIVRIPLKEQKGVFIMVSFVISTKEAEAQTEINITNKNVWIPMLEKYFKDVILNTAASYSSQISGSSHHTKR